jgi:hypothetical protein
MSTLVCIVGSWDSSRCITYVGPTVIEADRPQLVERSLQNTLIRQFPQRQSPHLPRGSAQSDTDLNPVTRMASTFW